MYDTVEEIQQKLVGCVLMYKARPVFVVAGGLRAADPEAKVFKLFISIVNTSDLPVMKTYPVFLDDPDLDYRSLGSRLGYMNLTDYNGKPYNEAVYLMRQPKRSSQYTQGLSKQNVYVIGCRGNGSPELPPTGLLEFNEKIYAKKSEELSRMLNGVYPSVAEVREMLSDPTVISKAFSRIWAIQRDEVGPFNLLYKSIRVGYSEDLTKFTVSERYRFHKDDLMRQIARINA